MSSLSVFTAEGPVSSRAREIEGEAPSRLPEDRQTVTDQVTMKLTAVTSGGTPPSVCDRTEETELSGIPAAPRQKSGTAQNDSPAESQDEDDNAVEDLMYPDGREEENGGIGTISEIAQGDSVAHGTVDSQESTNPFISQGGIPDHSSILCNDSTAYRLSDNAHTDTSFAPMVKATDVNISTSAAMMAIKSLNCHSLSNESLSQSMQDHEGSNSLLKNCGTGPSRGLCHLGPADQWNPVSHTITHDFTESRNAPNSGTIVNGPLSDPASDPAPDCSQEVCTRAADGAAVGGGSLSTVPATSSSVAPHADLRAGSARSAAATPPAVPREPTQISSPQVADEGPTPTERMSVDEEIVRFMEITLNGMAQVQDGLRGVFAIQKRRRAVQKRGMAMGDE